MSVRSLWTGFLLSLSLCLDLGIVNLAILRTALRQGGAAGFLIGLGSCAGDLVYFTLAVFGAAALLQWAFFRWALWLLGTGVLLFLAWRMVREVLHPKTLDRAEAPPLAEQAPSGLLATGAALALASPTSILWFAAVGGSVIASLGTDRASLWEFASGFALGGLAWSALFAYAAAGLRRLGSRLVRALSLLSALLFLYFAAVVFLHGLRHVL